MSSPKQKPSSQHTADPLYAGIAIKPPAYDPADAKTALDKLRPRLMTLPAAELAGRRLDVRAAALAALGDLQLVPSSEDHTL